MEKQVKFVFYTYNTESKMNNKMLVDKAVEKQVVEKIMSENNFHCMKKNDNMAQSNTGVTHVVITEDNSVVVYKANSSVKIKLKEITGPDCDYFKQNIQLKKFKEYEIAEAKEAVKKLMKPSSAAYSQEGAPYKGTTSKLLNSSQEEKFLAMHLNYYLPKMGLRQVNMEELDKDQDNPLYFLSSLGDSRLYLDMLNKISDRKLLQYFNTNAYQKTILVKFGFPEFIDLDEHMCGTILEVFYEVAHMQGNEFVGKAIMQALVGNYIEENDYKVTFV